METFGTLLTQYMARSGISDSELARAIGVRRQTIFRWKEGLVGRPRNRDDVMRCAAKLRLSDSERDALLIAGGFLPESQPDLSAAETPSVHDPSPETEHATESPQPASIQPDANRWRLAIPVVLAALVLAALTWWGVSQALRPDATPTPAPAAALSQVPMSADPSAAPDCAPPTADELLVLVLPFASYSPGPTFNVAGRIGESLQSALSEYGLTGIRIETIRFAPRSTFDAARIVETCRADLAIWGEYDSGRVRVHLTVGGDGAGHEWERLLADPDELTPVINIETPREVRILALLALGRLHRDGGDLDSARRLLEVARSLGPDETETRATLAFYLGYVHSSGARPDWDKAIALYDEAIDLQPRWVNARYNRGVAYLRRSYDVADPKADLDRAIDDLTYAIGVSSRFTLAHVNRGIAYYERRAEGDLWAADADFSRVVQLDPSSVAGHFNRALVRIRANRAGWIDDLERVLDLEPGYSAAHAAFCWGYALGESPETGLPHCEQGIAENPGDTSTRDARAIVLAYLGRFEEAAADLELYLGWVRSRPPETYARYRGPQVEAWIAELRAGRNPFNARVLASLR